MTPVRRTFEKFIPHEKETKIRSWAANNAYTLIFIAGLFAMTWVLMIFIAFGGL